MAAPSATAAVAPPATSPVLLPGIAEFVLSPRAWYLFESFGSSKTNAAPSDEYLLGGAAATALFTSLPQTRFVLTALYGTNSPSPKVGESFLFQTASFDGDTAFSNTSTTTTAHTRRLDLELLGVTEIPNSNWSWIAGARFEHHLDTVTNGSTVTGAVISPVLLPNGTATTISTPFFNSFSTRSVGYTSIYTGKGGLAYSMPLTADNNLYLFGNAMALLGIGNNGPPVDYGVVGPDVSVGFLYKLSDQTSFDFRYRAMVYFLFATPPGTSVKYAIYQGPMVGINIKF
jgi:hypothetical protein